MIKFEIKKIKNLFMPQNRYENFPNFIKEIHFPFYKGLAENTYVEFNFPLTVLVGQNGCGKSSVLQALETTYAGRAFTRRWFSTAVDPIEETNKGNVRNCYWYTYFNKDAKKLVQVLNTHIKKKGNPDYWEPSRPVQKLGMDALPELKSGEEQPGRVKTRWNGIKKNILYIDFREELSAFDKYFYFEEKPGKKRYYSKQDYLRYYSVYLKKIFNDKLSSFLLRNKDKVTSNVDLSQEELNILSEILGKNYTSITLVEHSLYKKLGSSVFFTTKNIGYSEAFAGSGEMSIVKLVHKIFMADSESLILLDEPEVSLHPGAQKKLLEFLLKQIKDKRHQIIISTHSPSIVEELPDESITVLEKNANYRFSAINNVPAVLAFQHIGHTNTEKIRIIVEDLAAKQLIEKVLISMGNKSDEVIEVIFHAGGAKDIFKEALILSRLNVLKTILILDGDQKRKEIPELDEISNSELDSILKKITDIKVQSFDFCSDGKGKKQKEQIINQKKNYLQFLKSNCFFLPGQDPEDTMWEASKLNFDKSKYKQVDYKERIHEWAKSEIDDPNASDIETYRKKLLKDIDLNHSHIIEINKILNHAFQKNSAFRQ